jgi:hypothetical protein
LLAKAKLLFNVCNWGQQGNLLPFFLGDEAMSKPTISLLAGLAVATLLQPLQAVADMTMTIAPDFAMAAMMRQVRDTNDGNSNANNRVAGSSTYAPQIKPARLAYSSSPNRTRANLARFVEKTRASDPAGAAKMQQLFASTNIIGMIDQKMQQTYGMRADNVADAYAVWWVSAWMGSKGRSDDATPGQMAMVKRQASNALASTREFASATDAGKQELAEAMLVQAAMIGDMIDTYKSDPSMLAKSRAAIAKGAREMGLDLNSMKLTDEGFVPSGKTGAVDPAPGAPDQALAANSAPEPVAATDTSTPYILLAAAGGAGIGGVVLLGKMIGRRG